MMRISILSDTHNLLRPEVIKHLQNCDCILHGGDISSQRILDRLEQFAPVRAVRGNNDKEWAEKLPLFLDFELGGLRIYMAHKKKELPKDLSPYDLVLFGHSHQYSETWVDHSGTNRCTLLLNPGSCGPRRFHQPITLAMLTIKDNGWIVRRIEIPHSPSETTPKIDPGNIKQQIEIVMKETQKGNSVTYIAEKYGMDKNLVEQIARLYVTHPGVTADKIMTKMGLCGKNMNTTIILSAIALVILNLISFCLMAYDKRCAEKGKWRIPERILFLAAACFGGLGGTLGMVLCRHKTKHWYFKVFFPIILIVQIVLLIVGYRLLAK